MCEYTETQYVTKMARWVGNRKRLLQLALALSLKKTNKQKRHWSLTSHPKQKSVPGGIKT